MEQTFTRKSALRSAGSLKSAGTISNLFKPLLLGLMLSTGLLLQGQVSITGTGVGNTYNQTFNTTTASVPAGWFFSETGSNANTSFSSGTGTGTGGDTYFFGVANEWAFGGLLSGSLTPTIGAAFTNNTGGTIAELVISYKGETWRVGSASRSDRLDFQYSTNATSLTTGTWTNFDALDYANPGQATGSGSQQHSANISSTISGLSIAAGATVWIRWNDFNAANSDDGMAVDDFSLYAVAGAPPTYTVTYDGNSNTSGTAPVDPSSPYTSGSNVTVLGQGTLLRTGYTFSGWNTAANGSGTAYSAGGTITNLTANTILYAQWTINTYTVTYDGNGNDGGTAPTDGSSPYNFGSNVTVLGPGSLSLTGFTFNGWNTAANGSGTAYLAGGTITGIAANTTLFAQWIPANTFSVTYFGNNNTGGAPPVDPSSPYTGGTDVTVLGSGTLTRTGYTFSGWNTAADGSGTAYSAGGTIFAIAANTSLFAQWTINTYTVTYDGNTNDGGTAPVDPSSPYNFNSNVTVLGQGDLTKTNYNFTGWNTSADGSGTPYAAGGTINNISSNITLYAQWAIITYTVTYNGNTSTGGTAPVDGSSPYAIGSNVTVLGQGTLVKTGHSFNGWNTAADGSGTSYPAGGTILNLSANTTLFAQWTINTYTVTYDGNGNTGGTAPVDPSSPYNFGSTITVLANTGSLTRNGFVFVGWNTAADGTGTNYAATGSATFTLGAANVILYARWAAPFYESFNYTVGDNIGGSTTGSGTTNNNWTTHSNSAAGTIAVTAGSLTYAGLEAPTGNKVRLPGSNTTTPRDINRAISTLTGTVGYYSFLLNVADNSQLGTAGDYFMGFGGTSGTSVTALYARLQIKSVNAGANYRLGITNSSGGTPTITDFATDLSFGTTYLVVVKHDFNGTSNDISTLWVNPSSLGGAEPGGGVSNNSATTGQTTFASIFLRNTNATPKADIDEIRIGSTWAEVTPAVTYQLTTAAGTGGNITAPAVSPLTVTQGAATTITAAADPGYNFSNWTVTAGTASIADANAASTTVTLNSGNATVQANFVPSTFTITATAQTPGGSISPAGAVIVNPGANQSFTITPDLCNDIAEVIVDGVTSLGAVTSYTFENVSANHTIDVYFNPSTSTTWTGNVNSNWDEPGNWSSCVPNSSLEVTIAAGTPNPAVLNVDAEVNSLTISDGATLSLSNKTLTINGGFTGSSLSTLTGSDEASIVLNSSATLVSSAPIRLKNLVINGGVVSLSSPLEITGGTVSSGPGEVSIIPGAQLESNGFLTIKSNQFGTGRVATGDDGGNYITGDVTVERYIPNNGFRSWRFLSVPTFGSQTIRQAWQEGAANPLPLQNNKPGYGTLITGIGATAAAQAAGFDGALTNSSFQIWGTNSWLNVTSTNTPIATLKGYMLFVRGDRSRVINGAVTNTNATTLRTTGQLYQGTQALPAFPASSFNAVGNLYASAIDFTQLQRTGGVQNLFYIWDSKKQNGTSLGAYQTFSSTNGFECTISGGSYTFGAPNTKIESGQAFFVSTTTAGTLTLTEGSKVANGASLGFRPVAPASLVRITSRLYDASGNDILDANVVVFNNRYSNAVAEEDAVKMTNPDENFGILQGSKTLAVEGRSLVADADEIVFSMSRLKQRDYTLEFVPQQLQAQGLEAVLEDSYLNTSTPLNLEASTRISFTVDANPASSAANRFKIVLRKVKPATDNKAAYTIAPNPVENGLVNLQFNNRPAGQYSVRILTAGGQPVLIRNLVHAGGSAAQTMRLPGRLAAGLYMVEITAPGKLKSIERLLVK